MTREQHLVFCKKCTNRTMDMQQGLLCALTGEKAAFENECQDFNLDASVKEASYDPEPLRATDLLSRLPAEIYEKLRMEQNYAAAVIAGTVSGLIGAVLWGVITVSTGYQIGYMAIAIGAGVGFSMRYLGKGIDQVFGVTGAFIAVLSCLLGNFLSIIGFVAEMSGAGYLEILLAFDYSLVLPIMTETFSLMDLVFYGLAGYEGYKFSFRTLTEQDLLTLR